MTSADQWAMKQLGRAVAGLPPLLRNSLRGGFGRKCRRGGRQ